jgi:DNA repair protein RadC
MDTYKNKLTNRALYINDSGLDDLDIMEMPQDERPREKMARDGPEALSDQELLALVLGNGIKGKGVNALARELLYRLEADKGIPSVASLSELGGMGHAKACQTAAMLEFGRRRWGFRGEHIVRPEHVFSLVRHYASDKRQERFIVISLNGAHEVLAVRVVTLGLVNKTIVHPREVFSDVIMDRASAVCVAHNHPSGSLTPSGEDDEITCRLLRAADILGITFLDHVIFTDTGYYSYCQTCRLKALKDADEFDELALSLKAFIY